MIHYDLEDEPNDKRGYPRLNLFFFKDGKHPPLADSGYWHTSKSGRNYELANNPPRGKYLRSLCIFILLAKYRSEVIKKDRGYRLPDKVLKNSWLATLGSTFGDTARTKFFNTYFEKNAFVTVGRGSGHISQMKADNAGGPASATYNSTALKLGNIRCFSVPRFSRKAKPTELNGKQLADMADVLEQYWVPIELKNTGAASRKIKQKWEPIVKDITEDIDSGRANDDPPKVEQPPFNQGDSNLPFTLSARWRELGEYVQANMSEGNLGGDWYVISLTLTWLLEWDQTFLDAVIRDGANVRIARHAPYAGRCPGVRSQWNMYFKSQAQKGQSGADYVRKKLLETKKVVREWGAKVKAAKQQSKKNQGSLEFYESKIPHPFMAVLHVPNPKPNISGPAWGAPEGTKCLIGLYSMYPDGLEERCGLFLHGPSPMLDLYYKSVLRFFELAPNDNYIEPDPK